MSNQLPVRKKEDLLLILHRHPPQSLFGQCIEKKEAENRYANPLIPGLKMFSFVKYEVFVVSG